VNANGNPGEWALAGARRRREVRSLFPLPPESPSVNADLNVAGHFPGPVLAIIRAKCVDCSGGLRRRGTEEGK